MSPGNTYHVPVLVPEVCKFLITDPGGCYVDGTLGGGGHAEAILNQLAPNGQLIGLDQDQEAIDWASQRLAQFGKQITLVRENFDAIESVIKHLGFNQVNGILLDLGVSSHQINDATRGFSYQIDSVLDMRMSKSQTLTARDVINTYDKSALTKIFLKYGEERFSKKIAQKIIAQRQLAAITQSAELRTIICSSVPFSQQVKSLSRIFQALRIEVNHELASLETFLEQVIPLLKPGGRIVIIAYHSLEDRIVKHFFKQESRECTCPPQFPKCVCNARRRLKLVTRKAVKPGDEEIRTNPRARSARLRAAEKN